MDGETPRTAAPGRIRGAVFELLREGQRVDFTIEESTKGPRAGEVRLIED